GPRKSCRAPEAETVPRVPLRRDAARSGGTLERPRAHDQRRRVPGGFDAPSDSDRRPPPRQSRDPDDRIHGTVAAVAPSSRVASPGRAHDEPQGFRSGPRRALPEGRPGPAIGAAPHARLEAPGGRRYTNHSHASSNSPRMTP